MVNDWAWAAETQEAQQAGAGGSSEGDILGEGVGRRRGTGRAPVHNVDVDDEKANPEKEAGVGDSAIKLHALILSVPPSSRSTPRRPVPTSMAMHTVPILLLCCLASTRPVMRTRDPT
jgi:hypothetical protein